MDKELEKKLKRVVRLIPLVPIIVLSLVSLNLILTILIFFKSLIKNLFKKLVNFSIFY